MWSEHKNKYLRYLSKYNGRLAGGKLEQTQTTRNTVSLSIQRKNKVVKKTMVYLLVILYSLLATGVFFVGVTLSTSSFPTFSGVFSSRAVLCCLRGDLELAAFSGKRVLFLLGFLVRVLGIPINRKQGGVKER